MGRRLTVLSWNVQGEIGIGEARLRRQRQFLEEHTEEVDLFLLQAVNYEDGPDESWDGQLGAFLEYFTGRGYHVVHSGTPSRKRLDHVLVSADFDVHSCEIWNGEGGSIDGFESSDHAPVVARCTLREGSSAPRTE